MQSSNDHYETAHFGVSEVWARRMGWGGTARLLGGPAEEGEGCDEDLAEIVEPRSNPEASGTNNDENDIEEDDDEAAADEEDEEEAEDDEAAEEANENTSSQRLRPSAIVRANGVLSGPGGETCTRYRWE